MVSVQVFENPEFHLRLSQDGDSFRVDAPDLARALGFRDSYDLVRSIPEVEKGYELVRTPGGDQRVWHVTEPGFYRALGQRQAARIKNAEIRAQVIRFQDWVYGEVLPAIRRTGRYQTPSVDVDVSVALRFAEAYHREHVVPASGRILAYQRWNKPREGMRAFGEICVQLELDIAPGTAAEITEGDQHPGEVAQ